MHVSFYSNYFTSTKVGHYVKGTVTHCNFSRNEFTFMIRDATLCDVPCNLSYNLGRGWDLFLNSDFFIRCATEILRDKFRSQSTLINSHSPTTTIEPTKIL